jgi:hypothetical protein
LLNDGRKCNLDAKKFGWWYAIEFESVFVFADIFQAIFWRDFPSGGKRISRLFPTSYFTPLEIMSAALQRGWVL